MEYFIFLDIDGVLNDELYCKECYEKNGGYPMSMNHVPFDPKALTNLMILVKAIRPYGKVQIILSSTWRLHQVDIAIIKARLAEYGLTINDITPRINMNRGEEIQEFLNQNVFDKNYKMIILDDESFDIEQRFPQELIQVNPQCGLSITNVKNALKKLNINF